MPSFDKVNSFILRHNKAIMVIFVLLFIPAYYAQSHTRHACSFHDTCLLPLLSLTPRALLPRSSPDRPV